MDEPRVVFEDVLKAEGIVIGGVYGAFSCQGYVSDQAMVKQGTVSPCVLIQKKLGLGSRPRR